MLLAIDIGNTSISLGFYKGDELAFVSRLLSDTQKSSDEYANELLDILKSNHAAPETVTDCILSSVVPSLTDTVTQAVKTATGASLLLAGEENYGEFKVDILPVSQIGTDLIAGSVGAIAKYPLPCLVADLGTATKILVIDEEGKFRGCTISPGVKISLDALTNGAALLPEIDFSKPNRCVGTNTAECMQSGIVYGTAAMLDGMLERIKDEMKFGNPSIIATGGYSKGIVSCCKTEIIYDENLVLDGLKVICEKARGN